MTEKPEDKLTITIAEAPAVDIPVAKEVTAYQKWAAKPESKAKRAAYMKEVLLCKICGAESMRCNMSHHHKSSRCTQVQKKSKYEQVVTLMGSLKSSLELAKDEETKKSITELKEIIKNNLF